MSSPWMKLMNGIAGRILSCGWSSLEALVRI